MRHILLLIAFLPLSGRSIFTKPLEKPVIEETLNRSWVSAATIGTLSLTPERRIVLINFANSRFCAEAPTEVGIDLASLSDYSIDVSTPEATKAALKFLTDIKSKNLTLNKRTQGVQLFNSGAYFTCQMYMNGGIDQAQLLEAQFKILTVVAPLIEAELQYMYEAPQGKGQPSSKSPDEVEKKAAQQAEKILEKKSKKPDEAPQIPK